MKTNNVIYYLTPKTSETGLKFAELEKRFDEAHDACVKLADEFGFIQWRSLSCSNVGGISSVIFPNGTTVDMKMWKKVRFGEYYPRAKSGIVEKFRELPVVGLWELNDCIGYKSVFGNIGFAGDHETYYGFTVNPEWNIKIPSGCTEITFTEYKKTFYPNEKQ